MRPSSASASSVSSNQWIYDKFLLKNYLTQSLDRARAKKTQTTRSSREKTCLEVQKHIIQQFINRELSARDFLIDLRLPHRDSHVALLDKTLKDLRLSLARGEFTIPGIISPIFTLNIQSDSTQSENDVNGIENRSTATIDPAVNNPLNVNQISGDESQTTRNNIRKRPYTDSTSADSKDPSPIVKTKRNPNNDANTDTSRNLQSRTTIVISAKSVEDGPACDGQKQLHYSTLCALDKAKKSRSHDQQFGLENVPILSKALKHHGQIMDDLILEHEKKILEFEKYKLDAFDKRQELDEHDKIEMADLKMQLADKNKQIQNLEDEQSENQIKMADLKSKLVLQLEINQKNESRLTKMGQKATRQNLIIQELQTTLDNMTNLAAQAQNSSAKLQPEIIEIVDIDEED